MSDKMTDAEFDELIASYQTSIDQHMDNSIDALIALRASGEVSEQVAIRILKFLIAKQVKTQIVNEMHHDMSPHRTKKSLKLMRLKYGRTTEEIYAI